MEASSAAFETSGFDTSKELLSELLKRVGNGHTQLPDFQRGWVWDDDHVRSLLSSVSLSYPIGAVMMLETGNPEFGFKPRLVEGVELTSPPKPQRLILDGQQRLTSLFQAIAGKKAVETMDSRGKKIHRWYYLDMAKALDPNADREEAIVGVPEDRIVRTFRGEVAADYSTVERECGAEMFPLRVIFDQPAKDRWQVAYLQLDQSDMPARLARWSLFQERVLSHFAQYHVPVIELAKATPKEAVCQVFEKVNTGGVSLTVFELLTATYAAENFNLRDDWAERSARLYQYSVLRGVQSTDLLQAVTLVYTYQRQQQALVEGVERERAPGVSAKRREMLRLPRLAYEELAESLTRGFIVAARLMHSQKIFDARDLPYPTQLTPLAAILSVLGNRAELESVRRQLVRWFWCGVFGELYGSATESRFALDLPQVVDWCNGGVEPNTVAIATFDPNRLLSLRTRNSAAYKGLYALLMRNGVRDFRTGEGIEISTYFDESIDIHHIFPKAWYTKQPEIDPRRADSIVNKTPLSSKTNRIISSNPPSVYLGRLQSNANIDSQRMDEILCSHAIDPGALRDDDFERFFKARQNALLDRIEEAMGKPISREFSPDVAAVLDEYADREQVA